MAGKGPAVRRVWSRARRRRGPARPGGDDRGDHAGRRRRDERGQPGRRVRARAVHHGAAGFPRAGRGGRGYLRGGRAFGHGLPGAGGGGARRGAAWSSSRRTEASWGAAQFLAPALAVPFLVFALADNGRASSEEHVLVVLLAVLAP